MENVKGKLGFGCMRLPMNGSGVDYEQFSKMIDMFLDAGFNYFDTAHGYVGGMSETSLKKCLTSRYPRDKYILTDKLSTHHFTKQEQIRPLFESQLEACGVDYFDFYLMHAQDASIYEKYKKCHAYETALEFTAADAIKEICDDLSINIVMMPELTTVIKQIYFDKTISAILTDILDKCDGDYNYDFTPEGLRIYKIGDLVAYPEFQIASNIPQEYSPNYRGNVSHSLSIEEMKNSVKITSEKDSVYTELMVKQNRELIDKYGFLQKIVKIDPEKESADAVAERELTENAKESETYGFEMIEKYDSYTRAGEIIIVDDIQFVILSTDHKIVDGWHFDKLELRKVN